MMDCSYEYDAGNRRSLYGYREMDVQATYFQILESGASGLVNSGGVLGGMSVAVHPTEDLPVKLLRRHGMEWNRND